MTDQTETRMAPPTARAALDAKLADLKRRTLGVGLGAGVGFGVAAGMLVIAAGMWLDLMLDLSPALRVCCSIVALVCGIALIARSLRQALHRAAPERLARRMDEVSSGRGQILAGVDLFLRPASPTAGASRSLTSGLAGMAIRRAEELCGSVSSAAVAPATSAARAGGAVVALCLAGGMVPLFASRLSSALWLRFVDPYGDHPPYSRLLLEVDPAGAKVVYGGGLDVRVNATGAPVDRVDLVLRPPSGADEVLPMFQEPGGTWRATLTHVTSPASYFVRAGGTRSALFKIDLITVPRIEAVLLRITPPAYTRRPPYEGPLPPGGIAGLPGTKVELRLRSNRPLSGGSLVFSAAGSGTAGARSSDLSPISAGASEVAGSFTITAPGKIIASIKDEAGQPSLETFTAPVSVLPDERPFVRILEPKANALATPDVTVPVTIAAEDDYGISRLQLFRSLNDSRALPVELPLPSEPPTRHTVTVELPLASYGLSPGDVIKLYARVEDNDPAGAKGSESSVVVLQIISQAEFQQMVLERQGMEVLESKYLQAERRMEALQAEIAKLQEELKKAGDGPMADELRKRIEALAAKMKEDADEIRKVAEQDLPFDIDKALAKELKKVADALDSAADEASAAAGMSSPDAAEAMAKLLKRLSDERDEFKKEALDPLEHLAQIYPLLEDEARYVMLYERQRDLADRLASLAGQDGVDDPKLKARMRDLEAEQRQIRDGLAELLDNIETHANQLPDDDELSELKAAALEIAKAIRASGATEAMSAAESGLAEFSGTRGHDGAKEAADIMEQFISREEGLSDMAGTALKFQPKLASGLGNTIAQLLACRGLGKGSGKGNGAGGGYSSAASTLQNTSLYGNIPLAGGPPHSGGDRRNGSGQGAGGSSGSTSPGDSGAPGTSAAVPGAGQNQSLVPSQYQHRVGEYFRRVADEIEEK